MRIPFTIWILFSTTVFGPLTIASEDKSANIDACHELPTHAELNAALSTVVQEGGNGGLGNEMWASIVDRDGKVCVVTFSGNSRSDQWPGSRVISAQKANTANAFSLTHQYPNLSGVGRALATGNLYGLVQPGGSLFGLQFSNPVNTDVAYAGDAQHYGAPNDPMVGKKAGGINVFGGGLALYDAKTSDLVGALGVSGDTSCTDHIIAWKVRHRLNLDNIPGGVSPGNTDNLILNKSPTPNSFEHPECGFGEEEIISTLSEQFAVGPKNGDE